MGFASGGGSNRDDEGSSGAERGGFGGWGGSRNEHGGGGDQRDSWSSRQKEDKAREEAEREAREKAARDAEKDTRRSVNPNENIDSRSFLGRIRDIFSGDSEEGDQMTDSQGNVVAESFTIDRPAEIQTVNLGEKTDYETIDSENPVESYARSVLDSGLVGDEQKEKDLARDIADAGRVAQAADVASTFGSVIAGPFGAAPGLVHDVVTGIQDDDVQKAGQSLYEGGKVSTPGISTAVGGIFGPAAGAAYDIANDVFGGSSQLGAFEESAGIQREPSATDSTGNDFGGGSDRPTSVTSQPLAQPPATLASTFSTSSLGTNVYSDFLDNFFKQG